jgi:hypothetical protein
MTTLDLTLSAPDDELPHPIRPDVPLWSENYAFVCYDAAAQVGVFTHIGRLAHNPDFWRGTTAALLPGGRLLISKTVGLPAEPEVPSSGPLAIRCEEPFSRWLLTHDAPAIESDSTSAGHALVAAGAIEPLAYELTFEQIAPVWDLTDWMRAQAWGHAHIEQAGRFHGTVRAGADTYALDCTGFRDHTLGPRNFASLNRTCWAHAEFPSGRAFCALRIWSPDDAVVLDQGFVYDPETAADELQLLTPKAMPTLHSSAGAPGTFTVSFHDRDDAIEGEVLHTLPFMLEEPNDLLAGTDPTRPQTKVIVEAPCRYTWNGETGYGWLERSRRIDQL